MDGLIGFPVFVVGRGIENLLTVLIGDGNHSVYLNPIL